MESNGHIPNHDTETHNGYNGEVNNGYTYEPTDSHGLNFITDFGVYEYRPRSVADISLTNIEVPEIKKESKKEKYKRKITPWLKIWTDYAAISTIHGIYHIAAPQPFLVRRILWLILFLGCTAILALQVSSNVQYFLSWPMSVDVKINYNDTITFPSVTICNQNAFRASVAYERGIYHVVNDIFTEIASHHDFDPEREHNRSEQEEFPLHSLALDELYQITGHRAEDLIVSCEWHGSPCRADEFKPILTDFGLCYIFNGPDSNAPAKMASQTGSEGGLRLHLNVEQYDYMSGPNPGAGLKLQVHNPHEPPLVRDHGIAIPPGSHAFISVKSVEVNNLKQPHGKCNDSVELEYYDTYAMSTCKTDCKQQFLMSMCGCRDIHMSPKSRHTRQASPVCLLDQYVNCMIHALGNHLMYSKKL